MSGPYRAIVVDPPWPERGGGGRGADEHYELVPVARIAPLVTGCPLWLPADDAHLYLWATNTHLPVAVAMVADLGFRYITCLTWAKDRPGLGQYWRGQTEHVLFGVRGSLPVAPADRLPTLIDARRLEHSRKPDRFYEIVEQVSPGPRLEVFARRRRFGWDVWGLEAPEAQASQAPMFAEAVPA